MGITISPYHPVFQMSITKGKQGCLPASFHPVTLFCPIHEQLLAHDYLPQKNAREGIGTTSIE